MSKNLIMGMVFGYSIEKIKPFVLSLRQHYQDDILFVTDNVSPEQQEFFDTHSVYTLIPETPLIRHTCQVERYKIYLECINDHFSECKNILIADVRDVVFQSDPFAEYPKHAIEFFAEPELFKNCTHNAPWLANIYGVNRVNQIAEQYVICSGTTMGTRLGMVEYLQAMVNEVSRLDISGRTLHGGEDQPVHNHLVYNDQFSDYSINQNGIGPISTMHHAKVLSFNRDGQLLNDNGTVVPVVHQYDRCGPMSVVFVKKSLGVHGKAGIIESANYAANNFPEHDLG
jgi:hypothetical protein